MVSIGNDWDELLAGEWEKPYYKELRKFLKSEYGSRTIYPDMNDIFNALKYTAYKDVRAVILGQDPYHGPGQAHGLCFSVKPGVPSPPSLQNIFKELSQEYRGDAQVPGKDIMGDSQVPGKESGGKPQVSGNESVEKPQVPGKEPGGQFQIPDSGYLVSWAERGVLLLNTVLTVRAGQANSHKGKGWEQLTDRVIELLNGRAEPMVFILWGANARSKKMRITNPNHRTLEAPHPSPLSAHNGFFGCGHFVKANAFLGQKGIDPIDWTL